MALSARSELCLNCKLLTINTYTFTVYNLKSDKTQNRDVITKKTRLNIDQKNWLEDLFLAQILLDSINKVCFLSTGRLSFTFQKFLNNIDEYQYKVVYQIRVMKMACERMMGILYPSDKMFDRQGGMTK